MHVEQPGANKKSGSEKVLEQGRKILLVDDESDYSDTLGMWLQIKGYVVASVSSGKEAIARIRKSSPDLVLLDINMPEMDGIETLAQIRELNKDLLVIMVTAYATMERMKKADELGAFGFFHKGDDFNNLHMMIQSAFGNNTKS